MKFKDIKVPKDMKFVDISTEKYRQYYYPSTHRDIKYHVVQVEEPIALSVSKSGGHRIILSDGISIYINTGWFFIKWKADPQFVI